MSLYQKLRIWIRAKRYLKKSEPDECRFVCDCLDRGMNTIDIGAHKAAFTYWMSKLVGRTGNVYAFEPVPPLVDYLQNYAATCWNQNISVCPVALSDQSGEGQLLIPQKTEYRWATLEYDAASEGSIDNSHFVSIRMERLDDYLASIAAKRPIDLIKCDVELHELAVFRGGREMLKQDRPILLFESLPLNIEPPEKNETFEFLRELGFEGYFFFDGTLVSLDNYSDEAYPLNYTQIQNFVFLHPDRWIVKSSYPPFKVVPRDSSAASHQRAA